MIDKMRREVLKRLLLVAGAAVLAIGGLLAVAPDAADAQGGCAYYHVVQPGENLYRIGLRYGVHYTTIAAVNGINPNVIYAGQTLCIPPSSTSPTGYSQPSYPAYQPPQQQAAPQPAVPFVYVFPPFSNLDSFPPLANSPQVHQVNFWPEYGGRYARDSVMREPMITLWIRCEPESVNYEFVLACSKTGLGYFPFDVTIFPPPPTPTP